MFRIDKISTSKDFTPSLLRFLFFFCFSFPRPALEKNHSYGTDTLGANIQCAKERIQQEGADGVVGQNLKKDG